MSLTLNHDGKTFFNCSSEQLLAASIPQAVIDAAEADDRLNAIKAECRRRIYAVASAEDQQNMSLHVAVIGARAEADRSLQEKDDLAAAAAALAWVKAMKAAVQTLAADADADFLADASWPACSEEAAALADSL